MIPAKYIKLLVTEILTVTTVKSLPFNSEK